jgi:hypothetical protein
MQNIEVWEMIHEKNFTKTERMKVAGGWLYRCIIINTGVSLAFVPEEIEEDMKKQKGQLY